MSSTLPAFTAASRSGSESRDFGPPPDGLAARSVHCVALAEATSARSISIWSATSGGGGGASGSSSKITAFSIAVSTTSTPGSAPSSASKLSASRKRRVEILLRRIARQSDKGLEHDCEDAIRSTSDNLEYSEDDRVLLSEIDGIRLK